MRSCTLPSDPQPGVRLQVAPQVGDGPVQLFHRASGYRAPRTSVRRCRLWKFGDDVIRVGGIDIAIDAPGSRVKPLAVDVRTCFPRRLLFSPNESRPSECWSYLPSHTARL